MWNELRPVVTDALRCRVCFRDYNLRSGRIDIAQVKWVGPNYLASSTKLMVIMINPGSGESRADSADERLSMLLHRLQSDWSHLDDVFDHQRRDMRNWSEGKFWSFFVDGLKLDLDKTAFANIAWCSTKGNEHPAQMLNTCFHRHTGRLIQILLPDVVLLSGKSAYGFEGRIKGVVPNARIVRGWHQSSRRSKVDIDKEIRRVRLELASYGL
jgi:hypothetical protein